jgi:hypothetical protein
MLTTKDTKSTKEEIFSHKELSAATLQPKTECLAQRRKGRKEIPFRPPLAKGERGGFHLSGVRVTRCRTCLVRE